MFNFKNPGPFTIYTCIYNSQVPILRTETTKTSSLNLIYVLFIYLFVHYFLPDVSGPTGINKWKGEGRGSVTVLLTSL